MAAKGAEVTPDLACEAGDLRVCVSGLRQEAPGHALTMARLSGLDRPGARAPGEPAAGERVRRWSMAPNAGAPTVAGPVRRAPHPAVRAVARDRRTRVGHMTGDRLRRAVRPAGAMAAVLLPDERDLRAEVPEEEGEHPPTGGRASVARTHSADSPGSAGPCGARMGG